MRLPNAPDDYPGTSRSRSKILANLCGVAFARSHITHVTDFLIAVTAVRISQRHGVGDPLLITFGYDLVGLVDVSGRCSELTHFFSSLCLFEGYPAEPQSPQALPGVRANPQAR
jgi:hypothetical protein